MLRTGGDALFLSITTLASSASLGSHDHIVPTLISIVFSYIKGTICIMSVCLDTPSPLNLDSNVIVL